MLLDNPQKTLVALLRPAPLCVAIGLLAGCAQPVATNNAAQTGPVTTFKSIKFNGVDYATPAAALDAERSLEASRVAGVAAESDPIKGSVRIVVPDLDRFRPLATQEAQKILKRPVGGEVADYNTQRWHLGAKFAADGLVQSHEFESATVAEQNDVRDPDQGDAQYVVWYQVRTTLPDNTGPWIGHWLVRRSGNSVAQTANFDLGTAPGAPRYDSFVRSVRDAVLRLGGASRAGATSSTAKAGAAAAQGSMGSGIVIDGKGHILTNEHVIRTCTKPKVTDTTNQTYETTIMARDAANDLAVLTAAHHWPEPAVLRDGHEPRPGDPLVVAGYPLSGLLGSGMTVTTGSLSALTGLHDDTRVLQLSAPIQLGNSGGPVLDESGRLVGIVSSMLNGVALAAVTGALPQNVNFAVKAAIIRTFLETRQIDYAHSPPGHELAPGDVGELARKFTVRVECPKGS